MAKSSDEKEKEASASEDGTSAAGRQDKVAELIGDLESMLAVQAGKIPPGENHDHSERFLIINALAAAKGKQEDLERHLKELDRLSTLRASQCIGQSEDNNTENDSADS
ncbi:MAG: hypothetical protein K0T99_02390 [Alphaproteobacteria bacterium]|nr:hypothetical protein [Alphaproteobacteria bacterium]